MKLKRLPLLLGLALALVALPVVIGTAAANDISLSPAEIGELSSAGSGHNEGVIVGIPVSEAVVRAAAESPGADVEGFSPQSPCWYNTDDLWAWWGIPPYRQWVREHRYWCATRYGGAQTYRASTTHPSSLLCNHSGRFEERVGGGNGYTWTTVRTGAHFACPTPIPYITYHYDRWQEYACNTWGNCGYVRQSG
jgi:hypothetical protein